MNKHIRGVEMSDPAMKASRRRFGRAAYAWTWGLVLAFSCATSPLHARQSTAVAAPTAPSLGFVGLEVTDIEAAKAFYVDGVGMKQALVLSKPTDPFQKIGLNFTGDPATGGTLLILIHYNEPRGPRDQPPGGLIGILVPDTHAAATRLRTHGYTVLKEPAATAKGPILTSLARDPDGMLVELSEYRGAPRQ